VTKAADRLRGVLLDVNNEPDIVWQRAFLLAGLLELLQASANEDVEIDEGVRLAARQSSQRQPGSLLDQLSARKKYIQLFRALERARCGDLIVGRKGHRTRFTFRDDQSRRELEAAIRALGVSGAPGAPLIVPEKDLDEWGLPRQAIAPERDTIVGILSAHKTELRSFGIGSLNLFGSIARNEGHVESDVDLLVTFNEPVTSDRFFGLKFFLEDLLGRRIDLVTEAALREPIRQSIKPELVRVA
jgi:predicted nucleotidyltransferase